MRGRTAIGALALALALGGCGVTYVSPLVREGDATDGVQVVPITGQSLALANAARYVPRSLPDVFSQVAGGGSLRGGSALPPSPLLPDLEPGALELRPPPPASAEPYRIGTGDVLQLATPAPGDAVEALGSGRAGDELRQSYTVRGDGTISIPGVGAVEVGGLTVMEAESQVFDRFIDAGLDPSFSLEVAEYRSQVITVGGSVGTATLVPVTLNLPTLDEAITAAGGLQVATPEYASIRIYRDGTLYQIPVETYIDRPDLRGLELAPGDSVFVDTSYDLDRALEYYGQQINVANIRRGDRAAALTELQAEIAQRRATLDEARGNFQARADLGAEERDYVYLTGEVAQQRRWPLPYGQQASLADALYDGGGFETDTGNPSQIYVLRASADPAAEPVTAWHLDATNAGNLVLATRFELRPDDIVFIEEQPITRWNRAFQQFFPTLLNTASAAVN